MGTTTVMPQPMIENPSHRHGFNYRHRSGKNTWIMTPARRQFNGLALHIDRSLGPQNSGSRFECDSENNVFPIANPTLDPTGVIGFRTHPSTLHFKRVVVFGSRHPCARKTRSKLYSLSCR